MARILIYRSTINGETDDRSFKGSCIANEWFGAAQGLETIVGNSNLKRADHSVKARAEALHQEGSAMGNLSSLHKLVIGSFKYLQLVELKIEPHPECDFLSVHDFNELSIRLGCLNNSENEPKGFMKEVGERAFSNPTIAGFFIHNVPKHVVFDSVAFLGRVSIGSHEHGYLEGI